MATIIKADVLSLPNLTTTLSTMSELAWVDLLAYVNTWDLVSSGDDEASERLLKIYLAAHLALTCGRAMTGAAGPVTSESAGQLRRSYGLLAQAAGTNALNGTMYGQMALGLMMASCAHGPVLL